MICICIKSMIVCVRFAYLLRFLMNTNPAAPAAATAAPATIPKVEEGWPEEGAAVLNTWPVSEGSASASWEAGGSESEMVWVSSAVAKAVAEEEGVPVGLVIALLVGRTEAVLVAVGKMAEEDELTGVGEAVAVLGVAVGVAVGVL